MMFFILNLSEGLLDEFEQDGNLLLSYRKMKVFILTHKVNGFHYRTQPLNSIE